MAVILVPQQLAVATHAASPGVSVTVSGSSRQPVGAPIMVTAHASGVTTPVYRFSVGSAIVRDFSRVPTFTWSSLHEGSYTIQVTVKDGFRATSARSATTALTLTSRVTGKSAVVSSLANPMVALYSAPACSSGTVTVQFRPATGGAWQSMAAQPCVAGQSVNVIVAGMRARTRYVLQDVISNGARRTTSAALTFTTGAPPAGLQIARFAVTQPPTAQADASPLIFHALIPTPGITIANPIATDLQGQLVWYYDTLHAGLHLIWPLHLLAGGTVLLFGRDAYHSIGDNVLREVDLAGTPVRETTVEAVNAQLARRGQQPIYSFHHDAIRLPNGDTAVLGETQHQVGKTDVMGDMIVVLDTNFQVIWTWDAFAHLTPPAKFGPGLTCNLTYPFTLCGLHDQKAEDWTHANGLGWSAADGDLTLSIRHLDAVLKIDYNNGHGSGAIVWRLGPGGSFRLKASGASWFSHQHNAYLVDPTTMVLFDNNNGPCLQPGVKNCHSRGQVITLDVPHHVATLVLNADLGSFRQALGSAQRLANGDYYFGGGFPASREAEFRPDGTRVYELTTPGAEYRAYRVTALSAPD